MTVRAYKFNNTGVETPNQSDVVNPYLPADPVNISIANNQSSPADVTGFLIDKDDYTSATAMFSMERRTATQNYQCSGHIFLRWDSVDSLWRISTSVSIDDLDAIGVYFTVTTGGQVRYTSSNLTGGSYSGSFRSLISSF